MDSAVHKAVGTDLWLGGGDKKIAFFFLYYTFISKGYGFVH